METAVPFYLSLKHKQALASNVIPVNMRESHEKWGDCAGRCTVFPWFEFLFYFLFLWIIWSLWDIMSQHSLCRINVRSCTWGKTHLFLPLNDYRIPVAWSWPANGNMEFKCYRIIKWLRNASASCLLCLFLQLGFQIITNSLQSGFIWLWLYAGKVRNVHFWKIFIINIFPQRKSIRIVLMKSKITSWGFPFSVIKLQADWLGREEKKKTNSQHLQYRGGRGGGEENETNESHHIWNNGTQLSLCEYHFKLW